MKFELTNGGKSFQITGDIADAPVVSGSGKSLVLASTNGNQQVAHSIAGENIRYGLNIYIPASAKTSAAFAKPEEGKKPKKS